MKKKARPKSTEQTLIVFEEVIRKDEVADAVSKFREFIGIPPKGIEFTDDDRQEFTDSLNGPLNCAFHVPHRIPISKDYLKYIEKIGEGHKNTIGNFRMTIVNTSRALMGSQGYTSERMLALMRLYVIFNRVVEEVLDVIEDEDDLLRVEHLPSELSWYNKDDVFVLNCMYDHFEYVSKSYPVAIYINPEATLNQVKDFISKKWSLIQAYREEGKNLYSGKRKKPRQEVNDFIYENKGLPLAQIRTRLAHEKGEYLDDGHIGKILSLERSRRKLTDSA